MLIPCSPTAPRGNSTTAARLLNALERSGHELSLDSVQTAQFSPGTFDLLIALHAADSGPAACAFAMRDNIPLVILFTGTDLNGKPSDATLEAVSEAQSLVTLGNHAARRVRDLFPNCGDKVIVIPQAVSPLPEPKPPGPELPRTLDPECELIFMPTGIRAVKDPLRGISALAPLAKKRPQLRLWIAGEALEEQVAEQLQALCKKHTFARWLGPIPRGELAPYFRRAQVILSTSKSEGGAPNALLEAGLMGRPLLASDIPAHREFPGVKHLFGNDQDLRRKLVALLDEPNKALLDAAARREEVRQGHALAREAAAWSSLVHSFVPPVQEP